MGPPQSAGREGADRYMGEGWHERDIQDNFEGGAGAALGEGEKSTENLVWLEIPYIFKHEIYTYIMYVIDFAHTTNYASSWWYLLNVVASK